MILLLLIPMEMQKFEIEKPLAEYYLIKEKKDEEIIVNKFIILKKNYILEKEDIKLKLAKNTKMYSRNTQVEGIILKSDMIIELKIRKGKVTEIRFPILEELK